MKAKYYFEYYLDDVKVSKAKANATVKKAKMKMRAFKQLAWKGMQDDLYEHEFPSGVLKVMRFEETRSIRKKKEFVNIKHKLVSLENLVAGYREKYGDLEAA